MRLSGRRIVVVLGDNFNSAIYHEIIDCLSSEGAQIDVAALNPKMGLIDSNGNELVRPSLGISDVSGLDFDALVLADGSMSDDLRASEEFLSLMRRAHDSGMIIGTIGMSARSLIDAGVAATHSFAASPELRFELETHGASYQNEAAWIDGNFVSGRLLEDVPAFCNVLADEISVGRAA